MALMIVPSSALVVDDEAHVRAYVKLLLKSVGVGTFYEAGNVADARRLWKAHRPGMVMLDVNMPGGTGLDLVPEIRAEDDDAYIVILTGNSQLSTVKEAVKCGADGFIRKDQSRDEVVRALKEIFSEKDE